MLGNQKRSLRPRSWCHRDYLHDCSLKLSRQSQSQNFSKVVQGEWPNRCSQLTQAAMWTKTRRWNPSEASLRPWHRNSLGAGSARSRRWSKGWFVLGCSPAASMILALLRWIFSWQYLQDSMLPSLIGQVNVFPWQDPAATKFCMTNASNDLLLCVQEHLWHLMNPDTNTSWVDIEEAIKRWLWSRSHPWWPTQLHMFLTLRSKVTRFSASWSLNKLDSHQSKLQLLRQSDVSLCLLPNQPRWKFPPSALRSILFENTSMQTFPFQRHALVGVCCHVANQVFQHHQGFLSWLWKENG